ncbi:MAG: hypothetical protein ACXWWU_09190 [Candidatus Limnocylindria bacterium]
MTDPRDPNTRATRLAANAAILAILAWAVLWFVTTQLHQVRAASPFGDDPWDLVASYAAIFLPIVVGATWVRSLRHRGPQLEPATGQRIRTGVAIALLTIGVNVSSDALAIVVVPAQATDTRLTLIIALVVLAGLATAPAVALLVRAMRVANPAPQEAVEPDVLDDLLGLVAEVPGAARVIRPLDRFLETSPVSPRRHRLIFGLLAAALAGLAFDVWHAIVEGPWESLPVLVLFGALAGIGVLTIYLITLVPLRLIRPAG